MEARESEELDPLLEEEFEIPVEQDQKKNNLASEKKDDSHTQTPEDNYRFPHEFTGNNPPDPGSGDDNPSPTTSGEIRTIEGQPKAEQRISISESYPQVDPIVQDIDWVKGTESRTVVAPLGTESKIKEGFKNKEGREVDPRDVARKDSVAGNTRVVTCEITMDGKTLMGQRRDTGKWTHPGGHIEGDEDSRDAAARELLEETGIKVDSKDLHYVGVKRIKGKRKKLDVHHYKYDATGKTLETGPINDPDKECHHWRFMSDEDIRGVMNNLHAPKDVVLDSRGFFDAGESMFMNKELDETKGDGGPGSGLKPGLSKTDPEQARDLAKSKKEPRN